MHYYSLTCQIVLLFLLTVLVEEGSLAITIIPTNQIYSPTEMLSQFKLVTKKNHRTLM